MKFVVHRIESKQHSSSVSLTLSDSEAQFESSINQADLLSNLIGMFESKGVSYGEFDDYSAFAGEWDEKVLQNASDVDLVSFSKERMNVLKKAMKVKPASTGGYIWFIFFEVADHQILMVLMLDDKDGINLEYDSSRSVYKVTQVTHLDLEKLHIGVKIDLTTRSKGGEKYLKFKMAKGKDFAKYFYDDFIQSVIIGGSKQDTNALVSYVRDYLSNEFDDAAEKMEAMYSWIESHETISLASVASYLHPNNEEMQKSFISGAVDRNVPQEIEIDKSEAAGLRTFKISSGGVSVKFSAGSLKKNVSVDKTNKTLTISDIPQEQLDLIPDQNND